ncbi:MAG: 3-isopropylmalate dehydratase small subunit [Burkholderiales bacterium]
MNIRGKIHVFGDHIDTDVILPTHAIVTTDLEVLAKHCFTGLMPDFRARVQPGDLIFAGENFGCGSSREHAPIAIKACGISGIVAKSFGRIFYRNAINLGLAVVECPDAISHATAGGEASVDFATSTLTVGGRKFTIPQYPHEVLEILRVGGLVPFMQARLREPAKAAAH